MSLVIQSRPNAFKIFPASSLNPVFGWEEAQGPSIERSPRHPCPGGSHSVTHLFVQQIYPTVALSTCTQSTSSSVFPFLLSPSNPSQTLSRLTSALFVVRSSATCNYVQGASLDIDLVCPFKLVG